MQRPHLTIDYSLVIFWEVQFELPFALVNKLLWKFVHRRQFEMIFQQIILLSVTQICFITHGFNICYKDFRFSGSRSINLCSQKLLSSLQHHFPYLMTDEHHFQYLLTQSSFRYYQYFVCNALRCAVDYSSHLLSYPALYDWKHNKSITSKM